MHGEPAVVHFYQELQRRLRVLPGVRSVAVMDERIGSGWSDNTYVKLDDEDLALDKGRRTLMRNNAVGPDFFHTLGVPVLLGREFSDADQAGSTPVAVVNELFAQKLLPGQSPLGHRVNGKTIVGVVRNHKYRSMVEEPIPMAWWDYAQLPEETGMSVEMRVSGDALGILPAVRKVVAQMDPDLPLIQPMLQREQFEQTISQQVMFARLAEFFGLLAIVLVATGLYGTLAYRVNMRTAEIGVRMAVGAQREQVVWMILKDSLLLTAAGGLLGIPLAMLVGRALTSALYGVKALDGVSYLLAAIGVVTVALAASAVPAARAASVDPLTALRTE
jgi:predicted permease